MDSKPKASSERSPAVTRFWTAAALLALATAATWRFSAPREEESAETPSLVAVPFQVGPWTGKDIDVDERTYELLETRNVLMREYEAPERAPVVLCLVFSHENRKVSHPPEVCYQGSGYEIVSSARVPTPFTSRDGRALTANRLFIEKKGLRQEVLYWYKTGPRDTDSYYKQQWLSLLEQWRGRRSLAALVRLSSPVRETDERTQADLIDFGRALLPILDKALS